MPQDSVASEITDDTTLSDSSPSAESDNTGTSTEASPEQSTPAADGTSTDATASADPATEDGNPGQPAAETETTSGAAAIPWEKRFKDTQSAYTKQQQSLLEMQRQFQELQQQHREIRQQYADVNPTEVAEYRTSKAHPPWDERSPKHQDFRRTVEKAETYDEMLQGETDPERIQALQEKMRAALGPDRLKMLDDWKADVRNQERERRLNPRAFYQKLIREESQPVVRETLQSANQQYQQGLQGREAATKWMTNKEVATPENIQQVLKLMNEQHMSFDDASIRVEREYYRSQVSNATKAKQSAEEKERLLQGNASGAISRNPSSGKKLDVAKHLKEKGITNSRSKIDELFDLDRQGLLPPG